MTGLAAEVALDGATNAYDRLYSYALPENCGALPGCRVTVPFGKGSIISAHIMTRCMPHSPQGLITAL